MRHSEGMPGQRLHKAQALYTRKGSEVAWEPGQLMLAGSSFFVYNKAYASPSPTIFIIFNTLSQPECNPYNQTLPQPLISVNFLGLLLILASLWVNHRVIRHLLFIIFTIYLALYATGLSHQNTKDLVLEEGLYTQNLYICEEPYQKGINQHFIACDATSKNRFRITTGQFPELHYGEGIHVTGKVSAPKLAYEERSPNPISGQLFYPNIESDPKIAPHNFFDKNFVKIRKELISFRQVLETNIKSSVSEPNSGLLSGIMLGTRSDIEHNLYENLITVGLVHIVALSGFNITIIAESLRIFFSRHSRALAFYIPTAGIIFFILATALSASVVRAAIMGFILLFGKRLGRKADLLNAILFAAVIMVLLNPRILLYDIGFQLSFAATLGIVYISPKINHFFGFFEKEIAEILAATFAAQLTTWPIISYYFGRLSVVSPLANFLVAPIIPLVMFLGFFVILLGFIWPSIGVFLNFTAWLTLEYTTIVANKLSSLSFSSIELKINSPYFLAGYYLLLFEIIAIIKIKKNERIKIKS